MDVYLENRTNNSVLFFQTVSANVRAKHTLNHVLVLALIQYSDLSALAIKAQTTLAYSECNIHTVRLLCTVAAAEVDAGTPNAKAHAFCAV